MASCRALSLGLLAVVIGFYGMKLNAMSEWQLNTDFYKFRLSAVEAIHGRSAYTELLGREEFLAGCRVKSPWLMEGKLQQSGSLIKAPLGYSQCLHPNLNPPFFVALTLPFAYAGINTSWWLWSISSFLSGLVATALIALPKKASEQGRLTGFLDRWILLASGFFFWAPVVITMELGQVAVFVLLLLLLAIKLFKVGLQFGAGLVVGVCVGLKIFLGLLIVGLLVCGFYRVFKGALAGFGLALVVGWLALGVEGYLDYWYIIQLVNWEGYSWNGSLLGMLERLEVYFRASSLITPSILALAGSFCILMVLVHALWFCRRYIATIPNLDLRFERLLSLTLILSVLLSPLGWKYYFLLLIIPVLFIWKTDKDRPVGSLTKIGVVFFIVLVQLPIPMFELNSVNVSVGALLYSSVTFFSLLMFYILFLVFNVALSKHEYGQHLVAK